MDTVSRKTHMGVSGSSALPGQNCSRFGGREPQNGATLGAFYDHNQSANHQGVLLVTQQGAENYNAETGDRRLRFFNGRHFCSCDFQSATQRGSMIALGAFSGEVFILDAATFSYIKTIIHRSEQHESPDVDVALDTDESHAPAETDNSPAGISPDAHLWSLGQGRASGQPVTCVMLAEGDVLVGDAAGCTRTYSISRGEATMTYLRREGSPLLSPGVQPQQQDGAGSGSKGVGSKEAVTALTFCTLHVEESTKPVSCLLIGYRDGLVCAFNRETGKCVRSIPSLPGLRSLHVFAALNTAVLSFAEKNEIWLWDLNKDDPPQVVDFGEELRLLQHRNSLPTSVYVHSERQLLLVGTDDAKIYVRRVTRPPGGNDDSYSIQLLRVGCPAKAGGSGGETSIYPISSLWYDGMTDTAFVGDVSGTMRVIREASGLKA